MLSWALVAQDRVPLYVRLPARQARALDDLVSASGRRKQEVGRIDLPAEAGSGDVLTLAELAALLRVPAERAEERALAGDIPGRRLGDEWRFSRAAVMAWLAGGDSPNAGREGG
jgi:excisionase family DNA binding protein